MEFEFHLQSGTKSTKGHIWLHSERGLTSFVWHTAKEEQTRLVIAELQLYYNDTLI